MDIWHRIGYGSRQGVEATLQTIGVTYTKTQDAALTSHVLTFEMKESDPRWPQVAELIRAKPGFDFVWTEFTPQEVLEAEWSMVAAVHQIGYAEPRKGLAWKALTLNDGCPECGGGASQKAPYRIKAEPRVGKNLLATVYGGGPLLCAFRVLDEFDSAGIRGYERWPLLLHPTAEPSRRVQQAFVTATASAPMLAQEAMETEYCHKEVCPVCQQVRYTPYTRGRMPVYRSALREDADLLLTSEWFGSGRAARQAILVSGRVARLVIEHDWGGIALSPVQLL